MSVKINHFINDTYNLKSGAPLGIDFLIASQPSQSNLVNRKQRAQFLNSSAHYIEKYNKDYAIVYSKIIPLSTEPIDFNDSLSEVFFQRNSIRFYQKSNFSFQELSFVLKMAAGVKNLRPNKKIEYQQHRMFPSGGALYTSRIYVDIRNVTSIERGLYLFNPYNETLNLVNTDLDNDKRHKLQNKTETIDSIDSSCFEIYMTIKPQLAVTKYGEHGIKVGLMELGHLAQNIWLVTVGCGLGGYVNTSFNYRMVKKFFRTDPAGEYLIYGFTAGKACE